MPIGKNAIKRVSNSGYSSVQTTAPDMENGVVEPKVEEIAPQAPVIEVAPVVEKAPTKATKKKEAPKKSMEKEPTLSPVNTARVVVGEKTNERNGDGYVNLGGELPYYLL